jgi:predicted DNA-binding protein YlxM (UPF0122 family)
MQRKQKQIMELYYDETFSINEMDNESNTEKFRVHFEYILLRRVPCAIACEA